MSSRILHHRLTNQRLATHHRTAATASTPDAVVGHLLAVQAQDAPLARLAIAQRAGCHVDDVVAAIDAGRIVRTHVLRPTWHYVLADDLPWMLELTGRRLVSGDGSRLRQLGLSPQVMSAAGDAVLRALHTGPATRPELLDAVADAGVLPRDRELGMRLTHVVMHLEADALIASGPLRAGVHTYQPWTRPAPGRDRHDAATELVRRFVASHGPVSVRDVMRWVNLAKGDIVAALDSLGEGIERTDADGVRLFSTTDADGVRPDLPPAPSPPDAAGPALLLSTFDEAFLSYRDVPWPRAPGHPLGDTPYRWSEAGGGPVLDALHDVGTWKRTDKGGRLSVRLDLAASLTDAARARVHAAVLDVAARITAPGTPLTVEHGPVPWGVRSPRPAEPTV